jgi:predicted dehydrogenase
MRQSIVINRRRFIGATVGALSAVAVPSLIPGKALGLNGTVAASERIVMGGLGIGPRGRTDLNAFLKNPEVQFVAVADAQAARRQAVKEMVDKHHQNNDCQTYRNMFDVLLRDDIDAVLIATGDRWHTMASICAAKAGKDIYCEKPCSMTIAESRALAETIRRYGRVYQAGTQRRNIGNFIFAINLVYSGKLGKLHTVHANTLDPRTTHDWLPAEPEPPKEECDWDLWLGPCPWRPFNQRYVNGGWRGHFDFHGGGILEWGSHTVDLCQWANKADNTVPIEFEPQGNQVHAVYANGVKLIMRDTGWLGLGTCSVRFEGDEGWIETGDSGQVAVYPESLRAEMPVFTMAGTDPSTHIRDFLNCVKSRALPAANADVAAQSHIACHAAYIAWQLGRKLRFDPVKEEFIGDEEANRMRSRALREPWHI